MQQGQKPHKSKRLNPPQFNGNSCGNLLRLNKALLRCNRLHPVLDRRSAPKAGTDVATDSCQPCRNVFQLRFDVVKRDENSAHPKRDCADKNPVFSAKRSPIDHVQPLSVVGHESTTRDFRREAAGLQASPPPSSESLRVPPPKQAARAAGRSQSHPEKGLSVRYSRDDVGSRDSLGDARVIFVIRPARGCADTGRRQHRRPVFSHWKLRKKRLCASGTPLSKCVGERKPPAESLACRESCGQHITRAVSYVVFGRAA